MFPITAALRRPEDPSKHIFINMLNIKKIALATLLVASCAGYAEAGQFAFGVKAGLNVNKLKFNKDIADASNSCGWTAGLMVDFTVPIIGIGADASIMYSRMNNETPGLNPSGDHSTLLPPTNITDTEVNGIGAPDNLYGKNFIEIPINIKYKFNIPVIASVFKPYVFTGPQFGLCLDKKDVWHDLQTRTFQMNWNVGIGVELIGHLQVGVSYGIGCNSVVEKITSSTTGINISDDMAKVKNNYWTVSAAWMF